MSVIEMFAHPAADASVLRRIRGFSSMHLRSDNTLCIEVIADGPLPAGWVGTLTVSVIDCVGTTLASASILPEVDHAGGSNVVCTGPLGPRRLDRTDFQDATLRISSTHGPIFRYDAEALLLARP